VDHAEPPLAEAGDGVVGEAGLLLRLADRAAPHVVAALGEIRVRVGEAELHEARALVDGRGRHRGRRGEVAQLHDDARVVHEFLGDGDGLPRIALAVLEDVLHRMLRGRVQLLQREVEGVLPLRAVLRIGTGERSAHADEDGRIGGLRGTR
jgi:hypothetical protein